MRKAEEIERLRFPLSAPLPVMSRISAELQKPRFVGMQFKLELPKPLGEFRPEPFGIRFALESHHDIVPVPHPDDPAWRAPSTPWLNPKIEHVMEIDIGHQRRSNPTLRRTFLHSDSLPILQ